MHPQVDHGSKPRYSSEHPISRTVGFDQPTHRSKGLHQTDCHGVGGSTSTMDIPNQFHLEPSVNKEQSSWGPLLGCLGWLVCSVLLLVFGFGISLGLALGNLQLKSPWTDPIQILSIILLLRILLSTSFEQFFDLGDSTKQSTPHLSSDFIRFPGIRISNATARAPKTPAQWASNFSFSSSRTAAVISLALQKGLEEHKHGQSGTFLGSWAEKRTNNPPEWFVWSFSWGFTAMHLCGWSRHTSSDHMLQTPHITPSHVTSFDRVPQHPSSPVLRGGFNPKNHPEKEFLPSKNKSQFIAYEERCSKWTLRESSHLPSFPPRPPAWKLQARFEIPSMDRWMHL